MATRYTHTNLIAKDWKRLAAFYEEVFGCTPAPPARDLSDESIERATGIAGAHLFGMHLRLPGYGDSGPTMELYQYDAMPAHPSIRTNTPGFAHIAFAVDDIAATARAILEHGGSAVGERVLLEIAGAGRVAMQYLADPEGNIVELQKWES
jgi:glyoxylase I family protein